jgi:hypothetical protein
MVALMPNNVSKLHEKETIAGSRTYLSDTDADTTNDGFQIVKRKSSDVQVSR